MADRPSSDDLITYVKHGNIEGVKKCINSGVDINREDNDFNQTPVTWAAEYGYMEILNILIESGADIHIPDLDGWTPLHYAAGSNESDMVQKLLDAGADINLKTNDCKTPLHTAAQRGNEASISVLIEYFRTHNASIDPVDNRGGTPLYYAASEASADVVRQLCNAGSNVNGLDPRARPLIAAARTGENVTVEVLLEKGADPKLPDKDGQLPIYWAAKAGSLELVELFLRTLGVAEPDNMSGPLMALWKAIGADGVNKVLGDVRTTDKDGWTALHLAASIGHANAIKALVAAKSHVNALDRQGRSPLLLAAENGKGPSIKALLDDNSKAVDVNIKDKIYERTALSWAAYRGDTEAVGLLAQAGSDVDSLDEDGQTPLILATRNGHSDSITKLLTFKPDLNIRDAIFEQSAVSYAAEKGHTEVVKLLIEAGCNIYSQTRERFSPLERAAQRGDPELLRLFFGLRSDGEPHPEELVRVKAIAEALHHACNNDYSKTRDLILAEKRYLTSTDEDGRTVLSWTVERGSEKTVKFLLDNGAKPDATDSNNRTPLSWAAERGSQGTVELLLASGVKPDAKDSNSRTPLSWAAGSGSQATVKLLLANGVKPDAKDSNSRTPLSWAAGSGSEETVELLLEKNVRPDSTDINNRTPLSWAAERGSLAVVKKLLSEMQISGPLTKKDQKAVDSTGKPQLAVDLKANDSNWTALWYAANGGHLKVTEALLEGGADPLVEDKEGINLMQYLSDGSSINLIGRNGIQKMLEPFFSLLAHSLPIFEAVEEVFQGMVLQFPKSRNREIKSEVKSVGALLISEEHDKLSKDSCLNWIHLPANNVSSVSPKKTLFTDNGLKMRWIEVRSIGWHSIIKIMLRD
jgi:ankyrin repeat protein